MDVQDGFILGIDNYCDRWCETCAFTSRCRVFADCAELEARHDPVLKAVADALLLPQVLSPPPPPWMQELIDEMNKRAAEPTSEEELKAIEPHIPPEHEWIDRRARVYGDRVHVWLEARGFLSVDEPGDPRAVIGWFHNGIASKIHRALYGLADDERRERDGPADHDGSAKVALLGIERSHGAWLELAYCGFASPAEIEPFISDLIWLSDELERVFPRARAFVRPGLDEPDEVAKLLASEAAGLSGPRDC